MKRFAFVLVFLSALIANAQFGPKSPAFTTVQSGSTACTGGADTRVLFNDGGTVSCGDAGLTYNKTTDTLGVDNIDPVTALVVKFAESNVEFENAQSQFYHPSIRPSVDNGISLGDTTHRFEFAYINFATVDALTVNAAFSLAKVNTTANCIDSAGDAACAAASAGSVVVDATDTTTVVSTTAVTANSQIFLQDDASLGTRLSVTCNTQALSVFNPRVTARTAGTSFTITVDTGPTTNPLCLSYFIVN